MWKEGIRMKNNKFLMAGLGVTIAIIIMVLAYFQYQTNIPMVIFTKEGSYASKYAKKHFLETHIVTTTELEQYTKHIEEFSYQEKENGIVITSYKGISKRLVIPKTINRKKVIAIRKDALNQNVETIVISDSVISIDDNYLKNKKIECFKNDYCESIASSHSNVTILNDSDYVDFDNTTTEFSYELKNGTIELIEYHGNDKIAIVPTTINGYEVNKISCDSKTIVGIFIPDTVKKIGENFLSLFLNRTYLSIIIATLISLLVFFIMIFTNKNENLEEMTQNTILYIVSIAYLCIVGIFAKTITDFVNGYKTFIIEVIIATIIYIVLALSLKLAKKKTQVFEKEIKEKTSFITNALNLLDDVDPNNQYHLKEEIRYSDPVSCEQVSGIEQIIMDLLQNIDEENVEKIRKNIKKRNNLIKQNK